MRRLWMFLLLSVSGCAFGPGDPFAILSATFTAELATPEGRDAGDGWQRLNSDYQLRVTRFELTVPSLALREAAASGPITFDPAFPPPGYTVCHNGHCDREDGALIPYAQVEAELSGGGGPRTVVTLPVGAVDVLTGEARVLPCEPSCDLPRADLSSVAASATRLVISGQVRDSRAPSRLPAAEVPWRYEGPVSAGLQGALSLQADNEAPLEAELHVTAAFSGALGDDVDWASATLTGDTVDLGEAANEPLLDTLIENLAAAPLEAEVSR